MSTYTIGEVAQRSGFSASALRYYEGIGLVEPAGRTDAGYRVYDDDALARLAFIARAKQLGCSLEEITDLVDVWDGERCGPVQRRLHQLVTDKIDSAQRQLAEVTTFTAQLRTAAAQLADEPTDGPCDDGCACLTAPSAEAVPIACTLEAAAVPGRLADWRAVLDRGRSRTTTADGGIRVELGDDVDVAELIGLVQAEQSCCAFFSFTVTVDGRGLGLEVRAPDDAGEIVTALFA